MDVFDQVNTLLDRAADAHERGKLAVAERLAFRDPNLAPVLTTLARLHLDREDDDAAAALLTRAIALLTRLRDPDAATIEVDARRSLGMIHVRHAEYRAAARQLEAAVAVAERAFGKRHIETARSLNSLGMLCKYTGRFPEGRRHYRRALTIALREKDGLAEDIYHNLGGIEHAAGRYAHAEAPARQGVALREARLGRDHPAVAEDIAALAAILDGLGRYAESEPIYARVLAFFRARRAHYDVAVNLHNLAAVHAAQGKTASAAKLYAEAEKLKRKLLGEAHPDTALTVFCAGMVTADRADKLRRISAAAKVFRKSLGAKHPHTVAAVRELRALRSA